MNHSSRHAQGAASVQDSASSSFASAEFPWLTFLAGSGFPPTGLVVGSVSRPAPIAAGAPTAGRFSGFPSGPGHPAAAPGTSCELRFAFPNGRTSWTSAAPRRRVYDRQLITSSRRPWGPALAPRCGRVRPLSRVAGAFPRAEGEVRGVGGRRGRWARCVVDRRSPFQPAAIRAAPHSMWPHPSIDGNAARRIRTPTSSGFGWGWAQCWRGPRTATRDELMHMEEPNGGGSAVSLISGNVDSRKTTKRR